MANLVVQLLEETAYLKGCLSANQAQPQADTVPKAHSATYFEVLRTNHNESQPNPIRTPAQEAEEDTGALGETQEQALLITAKGPPRGDEHTKISAMLRRKYNPAEYNLTDVKLKPIRGGTIILSTSEKGICKLEQELNTTKDITETYEVKTPFRRYPQFSVGQVKPDLRAEGMRRAILEQNKIEGGWEDISIIRTHSQRNGNNAVIVEVAPRFTNN